MIDRILGVGELAISDHRCSQPTLDELLRVAADAHVGGLMSGKAGIVHLHVGDGAARPRPDLARAGPERDPGPGVQPDPREPAWALFDEALALAQRGCTIDLTALRHRPRRAR